MRGVNFMDMFMLFVLSFSAVMGLLAVISPRLFERVATSSSRWVDADELLAILDKRIDIDRYVLPYSRWLGAMVLASVSVIGYVWMNH